MRLLKLMGAGLALSAICLGAQEKPKDLLAQGIVSYHDGDYAKAIEMFKAVIKTSTVLPELVRANVYLGYTYFSMADVENATRQIERTIQLDPEFIPSGDEYSTEFIEMHKAVKEGMVGSALFDSDPPAAIVEFEGRVIGTTPFRKDFLPNDYAARFVHSGYEAYEKSFAIKKGQVVTIQAPLKTGRSWKTFLQSAAIMLVVGFGIRSL